MKSILLDAIIIFVITLVVSAIVTYLYSLIVHGTGYIDWESAVRFAFIFGILFPWLRARDKKPG